MTKKIIAVFLICAMLIPFSSAVAADNEAVTPTIDEILSEYHQKAFEAQRNEETNAATYSRSASGSEKTLEQETVDQLTDAGYEAYHVTAENYTSMETELNTDFSDMGLDPSGSYIMVIHGEEPAGNTNGARGIDDIVQTPGDLSGGFSGFSYKYDGKTYLMRYITVTAADRPSGGLSVSTAYIFSSETFQKMQDAIPNISWTNIVNGLVSTGIDYITKIPIGTIMSLLGGLHDENLLVLDDDSLFIISRTLWTLEYIQILDAEKSTWTDAQRSAYATSYAYCTGYLYDPETNTATRIVGDEVIHTTYSPLYYNTEARKSNAVIKYLVNGISYDSTGDIQFYLTDSTGTINYMGEGVALFSHPEFS